MDLIARLDAERAACNVLEHPFYERWSAGELSARELALYAGEYRHAVSALARASALAARSAPAPLAADLQAHAREEDAHCELWEQFAQAAGARQASSTGALQQTRSCVSAWSGGEELVEHLAVLYAIEASQPAIAQTKLDGLIEHYGYVAEGPAVEYFSVHAERDHEHAREARELIEDLLESAREADAATGASSADELGERALACARGALRGNWDLLDGVLAATASAEA